jgi:hypothetical protein
VDAVIALAATTTLLAGVPPTVTCAPGRKFAPVMLIGVPPANEPVAGVTPLTDGGGLYM